MGKGSKANKPREMGGKEESSAPRRAKGTWIQRASAIAPLLVALCVYLPSLKFDFIFDDHLQIVANERVHSWNYLPDLLSKFSWVSGPVEVANYHYYPVFSAWLLVGYTLAGASAWLWHLFSILFHVLATYMVFRFSLELLASPIAAGCAALLFAVHPIHIESVCWVSASNEILYSLLLLSALFAFCRSVRAIPGDTSRKGWKWLSLVLWMMAVFAKETALALLPVFPFLAYKAAPASLGRRDRVGQAVRQGAPYLAGVIVYLVVRMAVVGGMGLDAGEHSWRQILFSSPSIILFYLKKLFFPMGLSSFYLNPLLSTPTARMWGEAILIFLGLGILAWLSTRMSAAFGAASALLVLPIFPVLAGLRVFRDGDLAHDRYLYLPSAGLCLLAGLLVKHLETKTKMTRIAAAAVGSLIFACFVWLTFAQQSFYRSDEAYFQRAIDVNPTNVLALDYLGDFYVMHDQVPRAVEKFRRAYELEPDNIDVVYCYTQGLIAQDHFSAAKPYLERLAQSPRIRYKRRDFVLVTLGQTEIRANNLPRAEQVLKQEQAENDGYPGLHRTLGVLYELEGRVPEAQQEYVREFQVSEDPKSRDRAEYLARVMRGESAPPVAAEQQSKPN